jgi:hypothetical protein
VQVLVEEVGDAVIGRAAHQGPEVDGTVRVLDASSARVGDLLDAVVLDHEGIDLVAVGKMEA